jgi:hypothetical protein
MSYLEFEDAESEAGSVRGSTAWEQPANAAAAQSSLAPTAAVIQMSTPPPPATVHVQVQRQAHVQLAQQPGTVVPTPAFRNQVEHAPPKPCCSLTALIVWLVLLVVFQIAGFIGFVVG